MSDKAQIVALTEDRDKFRNGFQAAQEQIDGLLTERARLTEALEQARRERDDFYMAYRIQCDRESKAALIRAEQAEAERDQQAGALVTLRAALAKLSTTNGSNLWHKGTPTCYESVYLKADVDAALAASAPAKEK
jgi:chromosome segregation ATPase